MRNTYPKARLLAISLFFSFSATSYSLSAQATTGQTSADSAAIKTLLTKRQKSIQQHQSTKTIDQELARYNYRPKAILRQTISGSTVNVSFDYYRNNLTSDNYSLVLDRLKRMIPSMKDITADLEKETVTAVFEGTDHAADLEKLVSAFNYNGFEIRK